MSSVCPVCGVIIPKCNKFCSMKCYKEFNKIVAIPEIKDNLHVGGCY